MSSRMRLTTPSASVNNVPKCSFNVLRNVHLYRSAFFMGLAYGCEPYWKRFEHHGNQFDQPCSSRNRYTAMTIYRAMLTLAEAGLFRFCKQKLCCLACGVSNHG